MRRRQASLAAPAALLALVVACQREQPAGELAVITPSATAAVPTQPPAAPSPTVTPTPASTPVPSPAAALAAYRALVADWQRSRSTFFAAVSDGRPRPVAEQRALAAAHLAGLRRFAAGVRAAAPSWPAAARTAARALLAANSRQQDHLAAMAGAVGPAAFTAGLADYGVGVAAEEQAVPAVDRALAR